MQAAKLNHPIGDEEFVSWLKSVGTEYFMGLLVKYHRQELEGLKNEALRPGDTENKKGQVMGLTRFLKPFEFLAETETDTGDKPETETDTAKE